MSKIISELSQKRLFKITNAEEKHHGYQYSDGLNILEEPFMETGSCVPGGFYFTDAKNILNHINLGIYLREISLPFDDNRLKVINDGNKWRSNMIILGKKHSLNDVETFKYLVKLGADINVIGDHPLCWAASNGYLEIVKFLVDNGANMHTMGDLPICIASEKGHWSVVKYFLEKDPATEIFSLNKALVSASKNGHLNIIKYLQKKGADIHTSDEYPMRIAAHYGYLDVVKYCIDNGSNVHATNDYALRMAAVNQHLDVVDFLLSNGSDIHAEHDYALRKTAEYGYLGMVKYLVSKGADMDTNYTTTSGKIIDKTNALSMASSNNHQDVVDFLISTKNIGIKN